jgi:hypothetical protein
MIKPIEVPTLRNDGTSSYETGFQDAVKRIIFFVEFLQINALFTEYNILCELRKCIDENCKL